MGRMEDKRLRTTDSRGVELTHPCQPEGSQFPLHVRYFAEEETVFEREAKRLVPNLSKRWESLAETLDRRVGTTWCLVSHQLLSLSPMFAVLGVCIYHLLSSAAWRQVRDERLLRDGGRSLRWM